MTNYEDARDIYGMTTAISIFRETDSIDYDFIRGEFSYCWDKNVSPVTFIEHIKELAAENGEK